MGGSVADAERTMLSEQTFDTPYLVIDNFLPTDLALAIRRDIETYFSIPNPQNAENHQVWNYRFVPGLCAYFRTTPGRIVRQEGIRRFSQALEGWAKEALGLRTITWPVLSMHLPGSYQKLHNEAANGRIAYSYSLTSDTRRTQGGQTLVFSDGDPIRANFQSAGKGFCTAIEPVFNRLVLFDTRVPHAVEQLAGAMDPLDGRFELHGYISESPPTVAGALAAEEALAIIGGAVNEVFSAKPDFMNLYHGPLCLRIDIDAMGAVRTVRPLLHRVSSLQSNEESFDSVLDILLREIKKMTFPKASGETTVVLPIMFGGFLPFVSA